MLLLVLVLALPLVEAFLRAALLLALMLEAGWYETERSQSERVVFSVYVYVMCISLQLVFVDRKLIGDVLSVNSGLGFRHGPLVPT